MPTDIPGEQHLADCLRQLLADDPDVIRNSDRIRSGLLKSLPDDPPGKLPDVERERIDAICQVADAGIAEQMREMPAELPVELAISSWLERQLANDDSTDIEYLRATLKLWADALGCDVRHTLVELVSRDKSIAFDSNRCRKALLQACPTRPFLISLLVRAIDGGVVQELEKLPHGTTERSAVLDGLEKRLTDANHRPGTGQWTLQSWLLALGHDVEPQPVEPAATLPWSLFTELLACLLFGVMLTTQLFWNIWVRDDLDRFWFGMQSVSWAMGTAIVVAGTTGLFASFLHKFAGFCSGFPNRRTGPGWIRRQTLLSVVLGCLTAWMLLAVEELLPTEWITPLGCVAGVILGLGVLRIAGKGSSILLLGGWLLVWFIYAFHWMTMWRVDPEHVCLLSNAPGVDGYFIFFTGVAGLSPTLLAGYLEWRSWKKLPSSFFMSWPDAVIESGPCLSVDGRHFATWDSTGNVSLGENATGTADDRPSGHDAAVTTVAFSPDGNRLATASQDMSVRVVSVSDRTPLQTLHGHCQTVTCLAWSTDGRLLASGSSDTTIRVWDVASGRCIHSLNLHRSPVTSLCFTSLNRLISGDAEGSLRAWSAEDGQQTHHTKGDAGVDSIEFIETRDEIAVRRSDGLEVLAAATLTSTARIAATEFKDNIVVDSAVVPERACLLISTAESLVAWDYVSGSRRALTSDAPGSIVAARLPDDSVVTQEPAAAAENRESDEPRGSAEQSTLLILNAGRTWRRLDESRSSEAILERLSLSPYVVNSDDGHSAESGFEAHQEDWATRFDNRLQTFSESRSPLLVLCVVAVLILGFVVLSGFTGSTVSAASTFAGEWLAHDSYESMLDPFGAWNKELATKWYAALDLGSSRARFISLLIAGLTATFLVRSDRWALSIAEQHAQFGTLAAARWFWSVPLVLAFPLTYEDRHDWFECLKTAAFIAGPISLFGLLIGWSVGCLFGAVKARVFPGVTREQRVKFNRLIPRSTTWRNEGDGLDWLLAACIIAGLMTGFVTTFGVVAGPVFEYALLPLTFQLDGTGTASGRGRSTMADEERPPDAIPVEEILQAFQDDPEAAVVEYAGCTFAVRGYLLDRTPTFTLTSPDSMKVVAHCKFAAEDVARVRVNSFPEALVEGQRVIIFGLCEGVDSQGLLFFSDVDVHWRWTFNPDEYDERSRPGSAGPQQRSRDSE